MMTHEYFMHHCLKLASFGAGYVAPNPLVGSVLVFKNKIIGEGWHKKYGESHAEINCINSVKPENRELISESVLYISLEPCNHFGKTPPCTELIIRSGIKKVVIGCRDPFIEVNGKGIEKLRSSGIEVIESVLEIECKELNKRFFTFHIKHRPYIILKWAQSADKRIAGNGEYRLLISNQKTNRLVHKWRSEEASILIGTNTAMLDDPELTTRFWPGMSPVRLVLDMNLRLPARLKIFSTAQKTIIFNKIKQEEKDNLIFYKLLENKDLVSQIINALFKFKLLSVIVEGGSRLIQSFIEANLWDEVRIITNKEIVINNGLEAPVLPLSKIINEKQILNDKIVFYQKN